MGRYLRSTPTVCLTDGDVWMAEAITIAWVSCTHLLCTWHFSQAFLRKVKPVLKPGNSIWSEVSRAFWNIASRSDSSTRATFDLEWAQLRALIRRNLANDPETHPPAQSAMAYLGGPEAAGSVHDVPGDVPDAGAAECDLDVHGDDVTVPPVVAARHTVYNTRRQWASRYTDAYFTMGAKSSQRAEGTFGMIKTHIAAGSTLQSLHQELRALFFSDDVRCVRDHMRAAQRAACQSVSPLAKSLCSGGGGEVGEVSLYARHLFHMQELLASSYKVTPSPGDYNGCTRYKVTFYTVGSSSVAQGPALDAGAKQQSDQALWAAAQEENEKAGRGLPSLSSRDAYGKYVEHEVTIQVTDSGESWSCSCQYPKRWGMPCRHTISVMMSRQIFIVPSSLVAPLWRVGEPGSVIKAHLDRLQQSMPAPSSSSAASVSNSSVPRGVRQQEVSTITELLVRLAADSGAPYPHGISLWHGISPAWQGMAWGAGVAWVWHGMVCVW